MKQTIITGTIILVIVGLLAVIVWGSKNKQVASDSREDQTTVSVSPTNVTTDVPIFFYGNTCPHCKDVEKWMIENKIEEKIDIIKKEVYDNRANSLELTQAANSCGLPTDSIGVPFLYTIDKKCLVGTPDIIAYLAGQVNERERSKEASESAERSQE